MDWYYKAGLGVGLIWAMARVLGAYGDAARELDIAFLFGFLLTTGGWAAVFLIIDRVAKFLGWKRVARSPETAVEGSSTAQGDVPSPSPNKALPTPGGRRSSRRPRR